MSTTINEKLPTWITQLESLQKEMDVREAKANTKLLEGGKNA